MNKCKQHAARFHGGATLSRRFANGFTLTIAAVVALTSGSSVVLAQNPIPVINVPLVPGLKAPGAAKFTLTVNGTGFVSGAVVNWNGNARTTTFVNSTQVTASIEATDETDEAGAILES